MDINTGILWNTSGPNFSPKSQLNTILSAGASRQLITWAWDNLVSTWDLETTGRGPRLLKLDYPGAGNAWGMYYMPCPMDYVSSVNNLMDGSNVVSFSNIDRKLIPRLVWNEVMLKGVTGFMMIHGYKKYLDE